MGLSGGSGEGQDHTTLSEINVTPLVDVMLVLLTIFMIASSVETIQVAAEKEKLLKERRDEEQRISLVTRMEKMKEEREDNIVLKNRDMRRIQYMQIQEERLKEIEEQLEDKSQNVPIELPKVTSEAVNLAEQKKIVVTLTREFSLYIGDTKVIDCMDSSYTGDWKPDPAKEDELPEAAYRLCLAAIEKKLVANAKLKEDKECYLRADRKLDYWQVLALMSTIRRAGITKFGLVSEEEEGAEKAHQK